MSSDKEPVDPVEEMLKRTGCIELHYKVQECIAEKRDWRQCQKEVQQFRKCMSQQKPTTDGNASST